MVILYVLRTWAINEVLIKMGVGGYADMGGMAEDFGNSGFRVELYAATSNQVTFMFTAARKLQ